MSGDQLEDQLQELRDAVRRLAIAALEPGRFTFDLHLLTLGLSLEEQTGARVVVALLLGAAKGDQPRTTWPDDAPRALHRLSSEYRPGEVVDRKRAAVLLGHALDIHPDAARRLLDARESDGMGSAGHAALDGG
jgi:hypothetical protein